jgi:hypothetical protein
MNTEFQTLNQKFNTLLKTIEKQRPDFKKNLGGGLSLIEIQEELARPLIPEGLKVIYSNIGKSSIDYRLCEYSTEIIPMFSFLPFYKINCVLEMQRELNEKYRDDTNWIDEIWMEDLIPFLEDGAGTFYYVRSLENDQSIYCIDKVGESLHAAKDFNDFFDMLIELYRKKAFFLDKKGRLKYDSDLEEEICNKYELT